MSRNAVATDSFTYSDGALETVSSSAWKSLNPSFATISVATNKLDCAHATEGVARWQGGSWTADQYAVLVISSLSGASGEVGVIARASSDVDGARDYYSVYVDATDTSTNIAVTVNGSRTVLSTVTGDGWVDGNTVEIECEGTTIRAFRNGTLLRSVTDSTIAGGTTDRAGVTVKGTSLRGDDWEGGTLGAAPSSDVLMGQACM